MRECDLIMKGGITSGVVYPKAVSTVARDYRLRSIGGTSAGAIAAAFAAAAEYRRQASADDRDLAGFEETEQVAEELAGDLLSLFQPSPRLRPLFDLLIAWIGRPAGQGAVGTLLPLLARTYRRSLLAPALLAGGGLLAGIVGDVAWLAVLGVLGGLILAVFLVASAIIDAVSKDLPAHDFGLCPGKTMPGFFKPAFTDWMADRIDRIAGKLGPDGKPGEPLTVGDLQPHGIEVAAMTTDLSSHRPYQLPLKSDLHWFSKAEFRKLFPDRIVDHLCAKAGPFETDQPGLPRDLHRLPHGGDFPVLLVARMSLSFPGLIQAVPLYRRDDQIKAGEGGQGQIRRCLFSDGGISSNFPIHFFDAWVPRRPTFGIALTSWEKARHGEERVSLPAKHFKSTFLPVRSIRSLGAFLFAIVNAAKDWQDSLQSLMPGYAERIVQIRLDDRSEGGLNLTMDKHTIRQLGEYGRVAGEMLVDRFDFDDHRWLRAVSLLPKLEGTLSQLHDSYGVRPPVDGGTSNSFAEILTDHPASSYPNDPDWRREALKAFADRLADIGRQASDAQGASGGGPVRQGNVPRTDSTIRLVADADRDPEADSVAPQAGA